MGCACVGPGEHREVYTGDGGYALSADSLKRGRGRPAIYHDNERVQAFMLCFSSPCELKEAHRRMDDALIGITYLQTEGQASTRPLSKRRLFEALQRCSSIDAVSVANALGRGYSLATVKRYTAIARVASKAITSLLDQHPAWEPQAVALKESREAIDGPYFAELQALGLM